MSERSDRIKVSDEALNQSLVLLRDRINHAFKKHGRGIFLNSFEALGVLTLEYDEFKKSIQDREPLDRQIDELLDVAAVAIAAVASIKTDKTPAALEVDQLVPKYSKASNTIFYGNLEMDEINRLVYINGQTVSLTPLEFKALQYVIKKSPALIKRYDIVDSVWGNTIVTDRTVDTHIFNIRKKLKGFNCEFVTVRGVGFRLVKIGEVSDE